MGIVNYNKSEYDVSYTIFQLNNRGEIDVDKWINVTALPEEQVRNLELISDIDVYGLLGSMVYQDYGKINIGGIDVAKASDTFLKIRIDKVDSAFSTTTYIDDIFRVSNIDMMKDDDENTTYNIKFSSLDIMKFNNYVVYSSNTNDYTEKSYSRILFELLKSADISVSNDYNESDIRGNFITPGGYNLKKSCDSLLRKTISSDYGLSFLIYQYKSKRFRILDVNTLFMNVADESKPINFLTAISKESSLNSEFSAKVLYQYTEGSTNEQMDRVKPVKIKKFSYDDRDWKNTTYNRNTMNDMLPDTENNKTNIARTNDFYNTDTDYNYSFGLGINDGVYDSIKKVFLFTSGIRLEAYGNLDRQCGDVINLLMDKDSAMYNKYEGNGFIRRVTHQFYDGHFKDIIEVSKPGATNA